MPTPDVLLAPQPNWPFEHSIGKIVHVNLADEDEPGPAKIVVYIAENRVQGHLPGVAARELNWR